MWWKKKAGIDRSKTSDLISFQIASCINTMQCRFGESMNKLTSKLTRRSKVVLLVGICLFFGGGSLYVLVHGLINRSLETTLQQIEVPIPMRINHSDDLSSTNKGILNETEFRKIKLFRNYLDSLQSCIEGKKIIDSIIRVRPGFMDSLKKVEFLYGIDTVNN